MTTPSSSPTPGEVRALADEYMARHSALDPLNATASGIPGFDHAMTDFSPHGHAARAELDRESLARLDALDPAAQHPADQLCARGLRDHLVTSLDAHAAGDHLVNLSVIVGDVATLRETLEVQAADGPSDALDDRLAAVPGALDAMCESWSQGLTLGLAAPRRQVLGVIAQLNAWAGQVHAEHPTIAMACARTATFLSETYLIASNPRDAVGPDAYARHARAQLGMELDTAWAYERGWDEVARLDLEIAAECAALATRYGTDGSLAATRAALDADERYAYHSAEAMCHWADETMHAAIEILDGAVFDIPPALRDISTHVTTASETVFYTPPAFDGSRPGRMWVPDRDHYVVWGDTSTCYHEGVPGHHLQCGVAALDENLSQFQRATFVAGHGEGWALYAERLADELGLYGDPALRLGYLLAQQFRAVRVVVDLGLHLCLPIPAHAARELGVAAKTPWDPELAYRFLHARTTNDERYDRAEIERYLGWPAQAISYKLGELVWLDLRERAAARPGFDLIDWHRRALALGPVGLDALTEYLTPPGT